jgi:uncharacterized protein
MTAKIIRDPLYNYISIERPDDQWLLDLLDTPEVQRLRRIHQLGVSHFTYPGADHSRLSHCLGVLHLMQQALDHLPRGDIHTREAGQALLAAALLHDVGHGPFSHLLEKCFNFDHEDRTCEILLNEETEVNRILKKVAHHFPAYVAALVRKDNHDYPCWQKNLLASQLDVDRLDYLRRDSLFTGAGYGHFDWYRILHTFELHGPIDKSRDVIWSEKSKFAIEEYIFARYYMYWNVYLHKTTRGFEKMLIAIWERARKMFDDGVELNLLDPIKDFWSTAKPTVKQFLRLEEYTIFAQIELWTNHGDKSLSDVSRRFLNRRGFAAIEAPAILNPLEEDSQLNQWDKALRELVSQNTEYDQPEMYCLRDKLDSKYTQPYFPEPESEEQDVNTSIRLRLKDDSIVEISEVLKRLKPLTEKPANAYRYYIPKDLQEKAKALLKPSKSHKADG